MSSECGRETELLKTHKLTREPSIQITASLPYKPLPASHTASLTAQQSSDDAAPSPSDRAASAAQPLAQDLRTISIRLAVVCMGDVAVICMGDVAVKFSRSRTLLPALATLRCSSHLYGELAVICMGGWQ